MYTIPEDVRHGGFSIQGVQDWYHLQVLETICLLVLKGRFILE